MAEEPFNPLDMFDVATEALRADIALVVHRHWTESPASQRLDDEGKFQSACVALTVSLATTLKAMTKLSDKEAMALVKQSLPSAFKMARNILANAEMAGETQH